MSESSVVVRPAVAGDLETIARFNREMAAETEGKTLDETVARSGVRRALADAALARYFIAEIDGAPAGQTMITFEWSDWRDGLFWWIQSVYVEPRFRRRGVFRALHAHIRALARNEPTVCGLRLYVLDSNTRAIETYHSLGMPTTDYRLCEEAWAVQTEGRN